MMSSVNSGETPWAGIPFWINMNAKSVFEKLIEKAQGWSWRLRGSLRPTLVGKPGELVASLSSEERAELINLTSEDAANPQREVLHYMLGTYPESNTTIHTHSLKKDNDNE